MVTTRQDTLGQRVAQIRKTSAIKRVLGSDFSPLWEAAERMTDCLLSSRSMVRIHQGASTTKPLQRTRLGMVQTGCGAPRSVRGSDQIKRSAVGLGDEGASLLI